MVRDHEDQAGGWARARPPAHAPAAPPRPPGASHAMALWPLL
eukprot:COSAG01_NODE_44342_length_420_cov_0.647975_1_plen_41_part_01